VKLIAGLGAAAAAALIAAPTAHADTNSYLDYLHSHHGGGDRRIQ
jgi:hypothetical protein